MLHHSINRSREQKLSLALRTQYADTVASPTKLVKNTLTCVVSKSDDMTVLDSWLCNIAGLAAACVELMKLHDIGQHTRARRDWLLHHQESDSGELTALTVISSSSASAGRSWLSIARDNGRNTVRYMRSTRWGRPCICILLTATPSDLDWTQTSNL
jgi:hypothetical protein